MLGAEVSPTQRLWKHSSALEYAVMAKVHSLHEYAVMANVHLLHEYAVMANVGCCWTYCGDAVMTASST